MRREHVGWNYKLLPKFAVYADNMCGFFLTSEFFG